MGQREFGKEYLTEMEVSKFKQSIASVGLVLMVLVPSLAQNPPEPPKKAAAPTKPAEPKTAPVQQVVTIVHRLNGLKMFRLLLRSQEQVQAISSLDSAFNLMDDVHTNVIAGVTMEDGQTIAAWLPEAEVELSSQFIPVPPPKSAPGFPSTLFPNAKPSFPLTPVAAGLPEAPDLTVIGPDGKHLAVEYVGLDAVTGLSILRVSDTTPQEKGLVSNEVVGVGESVRLFGPELAGQTRLVANGELFVRMGSLPGRILNVQLAPTGGIARFKVRSVRLSQANIGGVAVNDAGETLGIIDGVEGTEASILPSALIQLAVQRVLAQRASVPRPWLGVKGEAVSALDLSQMMSHGWEFERAATIFGSHRGIFLTSVVPGSPAANAALQAGDVILKINDREIQNTDDFTWFLDQSGPSSSVSFTLMRPGGTTQESVDVRLSGLMDPNYTFKERRRMAGTRGVPLIEQGIEMIELKAAVAARLGASAGLLVVFVAPDSPALAAGLLPGDVIELINGRPAVSMTRLRMFPAQTTPSYNLAIVRKKQKLNVTLKNPEKKN